MRNKLIITCLFAGLTLIAISCSKETTLGVLETCVSNSIKTKSSDNALSSYSQTPIDFFSEMSFQEWTSIIGIDNRFRACNVTNDVLATKTTSALANSLLHYPLNYLVFVYNDPQDAIRLVMENSGLHRAFIQRADAAQTIAELFARLSIDMSPEKSCFDDDYEVVSYVNEMFLEYFICSGIIPGIFTGESSVILERAARDKLLQRDSERELFSLTSKYPLIEILNKITEQKEKSISASDNSQMRSSSVIIHTFFKQSLTGYHFDEMSAMELIDLTNTLLLQYPNAIMRGSATQKYNCHSYAWHKTSTTNDVWIMASQNDIFQLSKYWTNDLYVSCTQTSAEKVYYPSGDHSAIALSNGKFLSKWGAGPLMEHDYNDCPYNSSNLEYYAERTTPLYDFTSINGNHPVWVNQTNTYSFDSSFDLSYTVYVRFNESDYPTPFTLTQFSDGYYYLTCYDMGYYVFYVKGYRNGICIAETRKDIVALPTY